MPVREVGARTRRCTAVQEQLEEPWRAAREYPSSSGGGGGGGEAAQLHLATASQLYDLVADDAHRAAGWPVADTPSDDGVGR